MQKNKFYNLMLHSEKSKMYSFQKNTRKSKKEYLKSASWVALQRYLFVVANFNFAVFLFVKYKIIYYTKI